MDKSTENLFNLRPVKKQAKYKKAVEDVFDVDDILSDDGSKNLKQQAFDCPCIGKGPNCRGHQHRRRYGQKKSLF